MAYDRIIYTTPEQQLEKLKSQNLQISNEKFALDNLKTFGYSNLIKSYRDPYTYIENSKKRYRSGITFEQLHSLYMLDKNLRNAVMAAMLDLEEHLKEIAAEVIANSFGIHQDQYLAFKNYRDRKSVKSKFSLGQILSKMKKALDTDKEPIYHYNNKYGVVPPWILFKSMYFGTIINYIKMFKPPQQMKMVSFLYDLSALKLNIDQCRKLMMDTLFISYEYRNIAAHGGRVYNYIPNAKLRWAEIFGPDYATNDFGGFSQLLFLLNLLKYSRPYERLSVTLTEELNRHCKDYPQDVTYLGQILNINITEKTVVFITEGSKIFHNNQYCSGMLNAQSISLEEAEELNLCPCKKCCT